MKIGSKMGKYVQWIYQIFHKHSYISIQKMKLVTRNLFTEFFCLKNQHVSTESGNFYRVEKLNNWLNTYNSQ